MNEQLFDEHFVIAVCFIAFIYLAYRPTKQFILKVFDKKINEIKTEIEIAENLRDEAKTLLDEIQLNMKQFEDNTQLFLINAQDNIAHFVENKNKEMNAILARKQHSTIKLIENEINKVGDRITREFMDNVLELVKKYLAKTSNNQVSDVEIVDHLSHNKFF
jgi:F0F1-type ATP synthase membrane subunit b/b'